MKSIYSPVTLLVALAAPLAVLAGDYDNVDWDKVDYSGVDWSKVDYSGGAAQGAPPAAPPAAPVEAAPPASSSVAPAADAPIEGVNKLAVNGIKAKSSSTPAVSVAPSSSKAASVPAPSSSVKSTSGGGNGNGGGNGGDNSPTTCTSNGGMMIEWTSNSETVPFTFPGGSGKTTPGSCTDLGNFAGQLHVNGEGGTIFEGNYNGGDQYFDVSFIIGYSAPMMCSSALGKSGCSIDLAAQGVPCPQKGPGDICTNPNGSNGNNNDGGFKTDMGAWPWCLACSGPDPFFQPCAGSGYTYPYDDYATQHASKGETIKCCIGTSCGTTGREGSTKNGLDWPQRNPPCMPCKNGPAAQSKRELGAVESKREVLVEDAEVTKREVGEVFERGARDMTPKLLKRGHKHRHSHVHAKAAKV